MADTLPLRNICIVGNIASGKSTLTGLLAENIADSIAIPEDFDGNPFLPLFVAQPSRWAFTNAVRYFYDYARVYRERTRERVFARCFIDAGGATNRYVYARYLAAEGIVTPEEQAFHQTLCDILQRTYEYPDPDAYIFAQASPQTCFRRMTERGWRYQTDHIRLEYLNALVKYFDAFKLSCQREGRPVLELETEGLDLRSDEGRRAALERARTFLDVAR